MSLAHAEGFIKKIGTDEEVRERIKTLETDEDKKRFAEDLGFSFTAEELEQYLSEKMSESQLSDEDLEAVAGGASAMWVGVGIGAGALGVGTVAAGAGVVAAATACGW